MPYNLRVSRASSSLWRWKQQRSLCGLCEYRRGIPIIVSDDFVVHSHAICYISVRLPLRSIERSAHREIPQLKSHYPQLHTAAKGR